MNQNGDERPSVACEEMYSVPLSPSILSRYERWSMDQDLYNIGRTVLVVGDARIDVHCMRLRRTPMFSFSQL